MLIIFSQIWHDERLRFDQYSSCLPNLTLNHQIVDRIWQPMVCFVNSKHSDLHSSPTPNTFLLIYPNGTVWVSDFIALFCIFFFQNNLIKNSNSLLLLLTILICLDERIIVISNRIAFIKTKEVDNVDDLRRRGLR